MRFFFLKRTKDKDHYTPRLFESTVSNLNRSLVLHCVKIKNLAKVVVMNFRTSEFYYDDDIGVYSVSI